LADPSRLSCGSRSAYDAGCRCEECKWARRYVYWFRENGPRRHRWREDRTQEFFLARQTWHEAKEAETFLWPEESREFDEVNPGPTFKQVLIFNRGQR